VSLADEIASIGDSLRGRITFGDRKLLDELLVRYAELAARQMAGEQAETSIAVVLASLDNIRVGVQTSAASEIRAVVVRYLGGLTAALTA